MCLRPHPRWPSDSMFACLSCDGFIIISLCYHCQVLVLRNLQNTRRHTCSLWSRGLRRSRGLFHMLHLLPALLSAHLGFVRSPRTRRSPKSWVTCRTTCPSTALYMLLHRRRPNQTASGSTPCTGRALECCHNAAFPGQACQPGSSSYFISIAFLSPYERCNQFLAQYFSALKINF